MIQLSPKPFIIFPSTYSIKPFTFSTLTFTMNHQLLKSSCAALLLASTFTALAQKPGKPDAWAKTITPEDLKRHLYIVAGPEMEGRETATPGQRKAAAYIEQQFRQLGLQPGNGNSYQMEFPVYQDSLVSAQLEVNGQAFQLDKDFNTNIGAGITATQRFSEVVFINSGASVDSVKNMNLTGKAVMVMGLSAPARGQAGGLMGALQSKGIAALLSVQTNYPRPVSGRKGNQALNVFRRALGPQSFTISENVARSIAGAAYDVAKNNKAAVQSFETQLLLDVQKLTQASPSTNVIGVLPGTDKKDEYLFITAHYDHLGKRDTVIYYGADDDGSGTVGVIEMAEAFTKAKAAGKGPRRTVVFMAVSGEEKGLWGSDYYSAHPIFPLDKTTADLNIDMIGRSDTKRPNDTLNYVYVVGDDKLSSELRPISEEANKKTKLQLDYKFNDPKDPNRIYFRSDHYNFAKKGVPIIFYYDGMLGADYHRPTDTPDKINYELAARRAQLVFYTAWEMANRDAMLKRDIPLDPNAITR